VKIVKRVCLTKADLQEAEERQARLDRQNERGLEQGRIKIIPVCKPCQGGKSPVEFLGGETVEAILFPDCRDVLCPRHALGFRQRQDPSLTMQGLLEGLQRYETAETGLEAPGLFLYLGNVRAPKGALVTA